MKQILAAALVATLPLAVQAQIDESSPAAKLCVKEMAKNKGVAKSDVDIYDMKVAEAATVVFMTVGTKSGAWKCFVTPQGKFDGIEEVEGRSNGDSAASGHSGGGRSSGGFPFFNATCPGGIDVHADEGGYVYFNGKQTKLKKFNREYYEATGSGITLSIAINPDQTVTLTYTGKHGANGVCEVTDSN
jgi:hypothetical protein